MPHVSVRSSMRLIAALLLATVALWALATRTTGPVPARPESLEAETDADKPRPDHPGEAVLFRRISLQDETGHIPLDGLTRGVAQAKAMAANQSRRAPEAGGLSKGNWTWLGPGNIGGRIRSIVISPTNPSAMWIGSVSGGIWKTTNGGTTWQVVDDFMANLAVSTMVINPITPSVMYAGTGEGFYNLDGIQGAGVFKSVDGGTTWTQLPSTADANWLYVNRLAISPNGATLLAATRTGLWRSTNGGSSWANVMTTEALDVNFDPINGTKAVASGYSGRAWYSIDSGQTWTPAAGMPGAANRVEVAYAPSNPAIVYASIDVNGGAIYSSTNGGQSYAQANLSNDNYLGDQGWYDNIIWVDPTNPNIVIVGGIDLWRSTDGGGTLTKISQWYSAPDSAHADQHAIVEDPTFNGTTTKTVYFGNDGGLYRATNVYTVMLTSGWQELNNNLGITQFYGAAGNPATNVIVGGTQDNGTLRYAGDAENWTTMLGGDGGYSAADPTNSNYFYGEYVYLNIHRSSDGGVSSDYISGFYWNGAAWAWKSAPYLIEDAQSSTANFIAPFIIDPNNANRVLGGGQSLWRTNDARTANTSTTGPTWASIKAPTGDYISAIAVAPGNSDIIWVGYNNGDVYTTTNGTLASPTWTRADLGTPNLPNRQVTRITIDPANTQQVYVTFGGFSPDNVWRTTDGGATWADITGSGLTGLPDVPVRSLVINPTNSNWLYVGTEVGIFASEDGGANWGVPQDGPANVSVDELFWLDGHTLIAATHGRGLYKATLGLPVVQLSSANYSVAEGAGTVPMTVTLNQAEPFTVTVTYATNNGTATAPGDYVAASGIVTFTPNVTQTTFNIAIVDDALVENSETFSVTLSQPVSATLAAPSSAAVTIRDNDQPSVALSSATYSVTESAGAVPITATLSQPAPFTVTVAYTTSNGTATAPGDYVAASGIVTFTPNVTQTAFNIAIVDDALVENSETFSVTLSQPVSATLAAPSSAAVTIRDNDQPSVQPSVALSSATYSVTESAGTASITATLSQPAPFTVTVAYTTSNGTATAPGDYVAASGIVTFTPNVTQTAFNIAIVDDALVENSETFSVTLSQPVSATLATPSAAAVTIIDDDQPRIQFSAATYVARESSGAASITVTLDRPAAITTTVQYATSDGTATAGTDYVATSGTLTITPGLAAATFNVPLIDDVKFESSEVLTLTLSAPTNATLGTLTQAALWISDNDFVLFLPLVIRE